MGRRFTILNGTALVVGAAAGICAVLLRFAIDFVQNLSFQGIVSATPREENKFLVSQWGWLVILVPAVGGLLVTLVRRSWPEVKQHGVTEVMAAVQAKGGVLQARTSIGHAMVSAITVGTGGSTGREGPIGYIGAALGSGMARRLGLSGRDIKILVGCGFSAGIAASFNTPLGGVLMALELIVPEFSTHAFIPLVSSTVIGITMGHLFLADQVTFRVPHFVFTSPWELVWYGALGLVCGLAAIAFVRLMTHSYRAWVEAPIPEFWRPAVGGLTVGILGLVLLLTTGQYHVFGTGYATVTSILATPSDAFMALLPLLLILTVAKPLATSITIGSGGGGGMFSVSLYQGVLWGGLVGILGNALAPQLVTNPASYALVGMGAYYAAATRATLTSIVMLTELTRDYAIVIPLMLAAVVADAVAVKYSRESVYTIKLSQTGILYEHDRTQSPLDFLRVRDVMTSEVHTLPDSLTVGEAFNRMLDLGHTGYPVVQEDGRLRGVITRRDVSRQLHAGKGSDSIAAIVPTRRITATPDEPLWKARDRLHRENIGRLIVVDGRAPDRVVGILTRSDVLRAEAERDIEHEDAWK